MNFGISLSAFHCAIVLSVLAGGGVTPALSQPPITAIPQGRQDDPPRDVLSHTPVVPRGGDSRTTVEPRTGNAPSGSKYDPH